MSNGLEVDEGTKLSRARAEHIVGILSGAGVPQRSLLPVVVKPECEGDSVDSIALRIFRMKSSSHRLSEEEAQEATILYRDVFDDADMEGDGVLSFEDFFTVKVYALRGSSLIPYFLYIRVQLTEDCETDGSAVMHFCHAVYDKYVSDS